MPQNGVRDLLSTGMGACVEICVAFIGFIFYCWHSLSLEVYHFMLGNKDEICCVTVIDSSDSRLTDALVIT